MCSHIACYCICAFSVFLPFQAAASAAPNDPPEPNAELAESWWPPMENVWTPIGWKDRLFRFNVLYNGTVPSVTAGDARQILEQWSGKGRSRRFDGRACQFALGCAQTSRRPPPST